jgi:hypothetical protein
MAKYVKRVPVFEAVQWRGCNTGEVAKMAGVAAREIKAHDGLRLQLLSDTMRIPLHAKEYDFVVRSEDGGLQVVSDIMFDRLFEEKKEETCVWQDDDEGGVV